MELRSLGAGLRRLRGDRVFEQRADGGVERRRGVARRPRRRDDKRVLSRRASTECGESRSGKLGPCEQFHGCYITIEQGLLGLSATNKPALVQNSLLPRTQRLHAGGAGFPVGAAPGHGLHHFEFRHRLVPKKMFFLKSFLFQG